MSDRVSQVDDKSGNGNDATQGTALYQPLWVSGVQNGKSILRFTGGARDDHLIMGDYSSLTEGEIFITIETDADPPGSGNDTGLWYFSTSSVAVFPWTDGDIYENWGSTVRKTSLSKTTPLNQWNIYNVWSASNDWQNTINEEVVHNTTTNTVSFPAACNLGIGTLVFNLYGDIGEVLIFNAKLSSADRTSVKTWLKNRWDTP